MAIPTPLHPTAGPLRSGVVRAAAALALLVVLAACDPGGGEQGPPVASLVVTDAPSGVAVPSETAPPGAGPTDAPGSPEGGAGADAGTGTAGRPQERLDDTPEERAALIGVWDACLLENGAEAGVGRAPGPAGAVTVVEPIPEAAKAACMDKLPLGPPELDPALNPHYRDDSVAQVQCLREHGVMVHLVGDTSVDAGGLSWTYDEDAPPLPADADQIEDACMLAAFGGNG